MHHIAVVNGTAPGNTAIQRFMSQNKAMLCQPPVRHFHEEKEKRKTKTNSPTKPKYLTCQLKVVHFVRKGSFCKKGLVRVMRVISLWLFYNENNIIIRSACNWGDVVPNGGDGQWGLQTEMRCVLYQLLLLGGLQQCDLLSKSECARDWWGKHYLR